MDDFRFEKLDIWKESIEISDVLFDYADKADDKRHYKFAEQLRSAGMSISNNIAEGSGSFSDKEFANFLNISRRSIFECANILSNRASRTTFIFNHTFAFILYPFSFISFIFNHTFVF